MTEEEHSSSLASTATAPITTEATDQVSAGGGRPQGELQVGASEPMPSLEPDMIDNLAQSTACNLVILLGGSYQKKVGKGLVYPHQTLLDDIQIDASSYVVVRVDMVHENAKNIKLEVPPDVTMLTLWDAITRRVQCRRTSINVEPSTVASTSTTAS
jgi:hypothetical protein